MKIQAALLAAAFALAGTALAQTGGAGPGTNSANNPVQAPAAGDAKTDGAKAKKSKKSRSAKKARKSSTASAGATSTMGAAGLDNDAARRARMDAAYSNWLAQQGRR